MRRLFKRIVTFLGILAVLIIVGVIGAMIFADRAVKSAVESAGAKTLNVPVLVGDADVSFLGGTLGLQGLTVKNPQGYEGPALLTLQAVSVKADAGSLFGDAVVIQDMTLNGMEVFVEQKGLQNNLYEVIKPLREPREPTGKRLIIDKLTISPDIVVHISLPALPGQQAQTVDFKIASITMTDLGRNERMDTALLISKVFLAVAQSVAEQSSGVLPKETVGEITNVLDKAINLGRTIFGGKKKE